MSTTTLETTEATEDIAGIVTRLRDLTDAKTTIDAEIDELKTRLRKAADVGHRVIFQGESLYTLQANRRFDVNLALELLAPSQITACQVVTVDPKKVKAQLPPVLLEQCMVEQGDPKVVLAS